MCMGVWLVGVYVHGCMAGRGVCAWVYGWSGCWIWRCVTEARSNEPMHSQATAADARKAKEV